MNNDFFFLLFWFYPVIVHLILSKGLKRRVNHLEQQLREALAAAGDKQARQAETRMPAAAPEATPAGTAEAEAPAGGAPFSPDENLAAAEVATPEPAMRAEAAPPPEPEPEPEPPRPPSWTTAVVRWLFTGNMVAKIGLLILFIGVSFLLKYVGERVTVPIEMRLTLIVLADLGLLTWAWRIRLTRPGLSLPAQGTALAVLMLVTFGAMRLYHLIPSGMAFALLFILTAFTALLAVLQNAVWLAVFAIAGGFVAPILTSTGEGSHIALFSYYALLNAGILAIALRRDWRALNLLGMAFTFVIGTTWGVLKYSAPEHYPSAQAFLLLFFLFYVALGLIHARRHATRQQQYIDATLVFGTPLLTFGLQLALTRDMPFGHAYSAMGFGLFYVALAVALWRRGARLRTLVESQLAMGVVFGTLALPLALDGRGTAAAWALEGAGLVWIGLRQRHRPTWAFGLLLQLGAWIALMNAITSIDHQAALHAHLWLGCLLLAASGFFVATRLRAQRDDQGGHDFDFLANSLLGVAALWLLAAGWIEIGLRSGGVSKANLLAASGLATAAALAHISARMRWRLASVISLAMQMVAGAIFLVIVNAWPWSTPAADLSASPLSGALLTAAAAGFTSWSMRRQPSTPAAPAIAPAMLMWALFWWFGPILNLLSGRLMLAIGGPADDLVGQTESWWNLYYIGLAASALCLGALAARLDWPTLRWGSAPVWLALPAATAWVLFELHSGQFIPPALTWIAYLALWGASERLMRYWPAHDWRLDELPLKLIHLVRSAGPWSMIWQVGAIWIGQWIGGAPRDQQLLAEGGWQVSGSWANFLPAWAMMLAIAWLAGRSEDGRWPTAPVAAWYRHALIPALTGWSLALVLLWNLRQDGGMAPLPYLPLLNPLDLSTGFALLLALRCQRMLRADGALLGAAANRLAARIPRACALAAYLWLNLMLLRSAAHLLHIPYRFDHLFASQAVQAMLSLTWSVTAMALMRHAAGKALRQRWLLGAGLLALVVAKLFLVDLSGVGSMARIVSFLGVGLLMVTIGYLAPYPPQAAPASGPAGE